MVHQNWCIHLGTCACVVMGVVMVYRIEIKEKENVRRKEKKEKKRKMKGGNEQGSSQREARRWLIWPKLHETMRRSASSCQASQALNFISQAINWSQRSSRMLTVNTIK